MTPGRPISAASTARWLGVQTADAPVEHDGGESDGRRLESLLDSRSNRSRRGRHLSASGDPGEHALIRIQRPDFLNVTVVNRHAGLRQNRLEGTVRADEPEPRDSWIWRQIADGRFAHAGLLAETDRHRARVRRIPTRFSEPEAVRVPRAEVERVGPRGPVGLQARGERRALVRDEEISRGEKARQLNERRVAVPGGRREEETHRIPGPSLRLDGRRGEQLPRLLENEFLAIHAGTSHTVPWASNRWPETREGSCPSSHAQNGNVTSGSGRSLMSCPGNAS